MQRTVVAICALLSAASAGCSLFGRLTDHGAAEDTTPASRGAPPRSAPSATPAASAVPPTVPIDRVVVRWFAPETGGVDKPQFVLARELAFEARLEAFADPDPDGAIYRDRHVRAALDRHIAETLLANMPTVPDPTPAEIAQRAEDARAVLEQRLGGGNPTAGHEKLLEAAAAEGISSDELDALLRRQAKASLYLDRMVAPMLEPTETELYTLHRSGGTPFSGKPFEEVKDRLKRWYVGTRLSQSLDTYYQNARSRISMVTVRKPQ